MGSIDPLDLLLQLGAAAVCGGLVGLERELSRKPAGLRTVILVAVGSTVFTLIAVEVALLSDAGGYETTGDLGRILQGIVTGLGMLGAGVFLHRDATVRLITSGASIWMAGAVGIACGLKLYLLAGAATALMLVVLAGLGAVIRRAPGGHERADS
jgi:putative Mg2+ transporter-C (MgtC) family protein